MLMVDGSVIPSLYKCGKQLSVLPLSVRALLLSIKIVQKDLLSPLCPVRPDIIEANLG